MNTKLKKDLVLQEALQALIGKYENTGVDTQLLLADLSIASEQNGGFVHTIAVHALQYLNSQETKNYLLAYMQDQSTLCESDPLAALDSFVNLATVAEMYETEELIWENASWLDFPHKEIIRRLCSYSNDFSSGLINDASNDSPKGPSNDSPNDPAVRHPWKQNDGTYELYSPDGMVFRKLAAETLFSDATDWVPILRACFLHSNFSFRQTKKLLHRWIIGADLQKQFFAIQFIGWNIGLEKHLSYLLRQSVTSESLAIQILKARPNISKNEISLVKEWLQADHADLQYWAAINLGPVNEVCRVLLREALEDGDGEIRLAAREVLGVGLGEGEFMPRGVCGKVHFCGQICKYSVVSI